MNWEQLVPAGKLPGHPDGAALDEEGHLSSARLNSGCLAHIAPDGTVDRVLPLPVAHPTSCTLGGRTWTACT